MGTAVLSCLEALMGHWLTERGNKERTLGVKREKSWGSEGAFLYVVINYPIMALRYCNKVVIVLYYIRINVHVVYPV